MGKHVTVEEDYAWVRGFVTALVETHRLLLGRNDDLSIRRVAAGAGVSIETATRAACARTDVEELVRAGVSKV
jgi:hypothetical protein